MVRRTLRRARPPQSMTSGLISSFFSLSAGSFLSLGASGFFLLLDLLEQRRLLLGQPETVVGVPGEEQGIDVALGPAAHGRGPQAVPVAEPDHALAAEDPFGRAVLEPALRQVDDLARAVGLDQADLAGGEAGHGVVEQDPLAVRAPAVILAAVRRQGQFLDGQERSRLLGGEVHDLEGGAVLDEGQLLAVGGIGRLGVLERIDDEGRLLEHRRGVEVGLLDPGAARLVDAPAAAALGGVDDGVAVGGERDAGLLPERGGDALGHAAVDVRGEDAAADGDRDLLAVGRDRELAGAAGDGHDHLVVGAGVGREEDRYGRGLGRALAQGVDRAVVAEAERAVVGHGQEADGVLGELGDLGRGAAGRGHAVDVEGAALLAQVVEALLVGREDGAAVLAGERRDHAVRAGLGIVGPDVAGDGRGVVLAPLVLAALAVVVEEEPAVAAELGVLGRGAEDLDGAAARGRDLVELGLGAGREEAVRGGVAAGRAEEDGLVVGREGVGELRGRMVGQAPGFAARRGHDEDIEVAVAVAGEGDGLAVAAPDGHEVVGFVHRQGHGDAAVGRDAVEVALVGEDDGLGVRRDGRVAQPGRDVVRGRRGRLGRHGDDECGQGAEPEENKTETETATMHGELLIHLLIRRTRPRARWPEPDDDNKKEGLNANPG